MAAQMPKAKLLAFITAAKSTAFDNCQMHLYSDGPALDIALTTDPAAFTECSFGGYSSVPSLTWNAALYDQTSDAVVLTLPSQLFTHDGTSDAGDTAVGYYVTKSSLVIAAEAFPVSVAIPSASYGVDVNASMKFYAPIAG